jgi:hypothetical protein
LLITKRSGAGFSDLLSIAYGMTPSA